MANRRPKSQLTSYSQSQSISNRRRSIRQRGIAGMMIAFLLLGGYLVISPFLTTSSNSSGTTIAFTWPWQKSTPKTSTAPKASNYTVQVNDPAPSSAQPTASAQKPGTLVVDDPVAPGKPGVITNDTCWVDYTQDLTMRTTAQQLLAVCKSALPTIEARLAAKKASRPMVVILGSFTGMDKFSYLGTKFCGGEQTAGCVLIQNGTPKAAYLQAPYILRAPNDATYVLVHELTHVVQNVSPASISWVNEGAADYITYSIGYRNRIPGCWGDENYLSGYGCAAAFFQYISRAYDSTIVRKLNSNNNTKVDQIIQSATGKSVVQLYIECLQGECSGGKPVEYDKNGKVNMEQLTNIKRATITSGQAKKSPNSSSRSRICPKTTGVTALGEFMYTRLTGLVGR